MAVAAAALTFLCVRRQLVLAAVGVVSDSNCWLPKRKRERKSRRRRRRRLHSDDVRRQPDAVLSAPSGACAQPPPAHCAGATASAVHTAEVRLAKKQVAPERVGRPRAAASRDASKFTLFSHHLISSNKMLTNLQRREEASISLAITQVWHQESNHCDHLFTALLTLEFNRPWLAAKVFSAELVKRLT